MKRFDGGLYRHKNNRDIAFEIIKVFYIKEKDLYTLRVTWWNIGSCHSPWPMGISQRINIPGDKIGDWIRFSGKLPPSEHRVITI